MAEDGTSAFKRYFDVFSAKPGGSKAEQYGRVPVPGEAEVVLPGGRVRLYYGADMALGGGDDGFSPPRALGVRIVGPAGTEVPIRYKLRFGNASSTRKSVSRTYIGRFEAEPGDYKVTVSFDGDVGESRFVSLGR